MALEWPKRLRQEANRSEQKLETNTAQQIGSGSSYLAPLARRFGSVRFGPAWFSFGSVSCSARVWWRAHPRLSLEPLINLINLGSRSGCHRASQPTAAEPPASSGRLPNWEASLFDWPASLRRELPSGVTWLAGRIQAIVKTTTTTSTTMTHHRLRP